ncbi:MAG: hypothetical protein SynsKO_04850 [Synoicihabitans sp.]
MKPSELKRRFDELDAGRAMDDLTPDEAVEWQRLVDEHGFSSDTGLDLLAAGLEASRPDSGVSPSGSLIDRLENEAHAFAEVAETPDAKIIPFWRHPALGWAAAAVLAVGLWVSQPDPVEEAPSLAEQRATLLASNDALQLEFAGTPDFAALGGDVIWQDDSQTGYLRFNGLPVNDPTEAQYQLWIVDPERDERPVDGGVFDIPAGGGNVIIPIRAALRVDDPVAFVITVEQPGGVVVSKQEIVAAIASRG